MSYLSPWGQARGGRAVGGTFLPPVGKRARRGSVTMDVGSVLLRDVSFGVAMRISVFGWGGFSSLGYILDLLGQIIHPLWSLAEWEGPEA